MEGKELPEDGRETGENGQGKRKKKVVKPVKKAR